MQWNDKLCDAALLSVWWLHMNDLISWSALRMSATFLSEQFKYVNEWKAARSGAISSFDWSTDVLCRRCGATTLLHVTTLPPCGSFIQLLHFTTLLTKSKKVFLSFFTTLSPLTVDTLIGSQHRGPSNPTFWGILNCLCRENVGHLSYKTRKSIQSFIRSCQSFPRYDRKWTSGLTGVRHHWTEWSHLECVESQQSSSSKSTAADLTGLFVIIL